MKRKKRDVREGRQTTLSAEQAKAIELLGSGQSVADSADGSGVNRSTLYRWMRSDEQFIAALNAWRNAQAKLARTRLSGLTTRAIDAVQAALEAGDGKLGMVMLQRMGLLTPHVAAPEEPEEVRRDLESDLREQRSRVENRVVSTTMGMPGL